MMTLELVAPTGQSTRTGPSLGDFGFDARSLGGTLLLGACRAVPASDVIFEVKPSG
jgi:hypothetical protein